MKALSKKNHLRQWAGVPIKSRGFLLNGKTRIGLNNLPYEPSREGKETVHEPSEIEVQAESKNESYRTPVSLLNTEKNL
jgi:hypothetical protein